MNLAPDLWCDKFGLMIMDEVHRVPAEKFRQVIERGNAHVRLGFTATDFRKDGRFVNARWHLGNPIYRKEEYVNSVPLNYHGIRTPFGLMRNKEDFTFAELVTDLTNNQRRNEAIAALVKRIGDTEPGDILVVSSRVDHINTLEPLMPFPTAVIVGTTPGKERARTYQDILDGKVKVTIATQSIMSEGASNPRWHHVVVTTPFSDPKTAIQLAGRVIRMREGKTEGNFWHLVDANPMCSAMARKVWNALKKNMKTSTVHDLAALLQ
jgi:superfamily II DNA or RNA helicase